MISEINQTKEDKSSYVNILNYDGSDEKYHYFRFTSGALGQKKYKVPRGLLIVKEEKPISDGYLNLSVWKIGNLWTSSRKDSEQKTASGEYILAWEEDSLAEQEGIIILVAPTLKKEEDQP